MGNQCCSKREDVEPRSIYTGLKPSGNDGERYIFFVSCFRFLNRFLFKKSLQLLNSLIALFLHDDALINCKQASTAREDFE